jgi:hypothetical protein
MLGNQNIKIELEKEWVAMKKMNEDFVFMTTDTSHMDTEVKTWYMEEWAAFMPCRRTTPTTILQHQQVQYKRLQHWQRRKSNNLYRQRKIHR